MAYNDDSVLAKLSAVNESHESIASSAQWILFHKRYADRTVHLWMQKLKNSSSTKRLSLIYLANEVSQQSKARNKMEFISAFSPVIAEALATAYKGAPTEIQGKLRRVIDVWRDRSVFDASIQADIDKRLSDLDKNRGSVSSTAFGSLDSVKLPKELAALAPLYQAVTAHTLPVKTASSSADHEYTKLKGSPSVSSSPPVYAARLNGVLKLLGTAEHAMNDSVKARRELVNLLDKILETNRSALAEEEANLAEVRKRKHEISDTRDAIESDIMRGLSNRKSEASAADTLHADGHRTHSDPARPEVEALTPDTWADGGSDEAMNPTSYHALHNGENGSNKRRRVENDEENAGAVPATETSSVTAQVNSV